MALIDSNVDPSEVAKFDTVASRWWDPSGEFKTLHAINPLRLQYINDRCRLQGSDVADIGCGGGILAESMAAAGARVTAIDASQGAITTARLHQLQTGSTVTYEHSTPESFAASHAQNFDVVTCMEMLEHVPDPAATIAACAQMARPGGQIFFSTLNRTARAYFLAIVGAEYVLQLLPKGTHEYARFIRPSELAGWLRASALELRDLRGMSYDPLSSRCRLTPSLAVNYLVHSVKEAE